MTTQPSPASSREAPTIVPPVASADGVAIPVADAVADGVAIPVPVAVADAPVTGRSAPDNRHPFLAALGERVRALRARRGLTRKALSTASGVSERHLANLETGVGNASILVLAQVAQALDCALAELIGDPTTRSPEWLLIRELLQGRDEATLQRVRVSLAEVLGAPRAVDGAAGPARARIALIGLRGAGKSTLGRMLADDLPLPFIELSREIEKVAGFGVDEIQALYGAGAYRRYERRALEEAVRLHDDAVIATPGGLVSDPATFNLLLSTCTTVWLRATPEDHMRRVVTQGDTRPMSASREAMEDLKGILTSRADFYAQADFQLDTSAGSLETTFERLRQLVRTARRPNA